MVLVLHHKTQNKCVFSSFFYGPDVNPFFNNKCKEKTLHICMKNDTMLPNKIIKSFDIQDVYDFLYLCG